jgi:hypothetical protein
MADGRLSGAEIIALAERQTGAYGLVDEGLRERVRVVVERFNSRAPYNQAQLTAMSAQILHMLRVRLGLALDRQRFPAIQDEEIRRPLFIIGFPRSGTTLLHSLMAEDPAAHALQSWHIYAPSPPPGAGPVAAERIALAQRKMERWMDFCPAQKAMHPYVDKGAYQLAEDEEVFSIDFRNAYPYHYHDVPALQPGDVGVIGDKEEAFAFHREFLQHLQWRTGKRRWVCKGPSASLQLKALFEVYPDAACVWPHRPLADVYASNVALRAVTYDAIQGHAVDWAAQARESAMRMKRAYDELLASSLIDDPRILHVDFTEIASDPAAAVETAYRHFAIPIEAEFPGRMRAWLADPGNDAARHGRYPYSYEAFNLSREWIEELFSDYSRRFGLA